MYAVDRLNRNYVICFISLLTQTIYGKNEQGTDP
jgi:hypothetical protein